MVTVSRNISNQNAKRKKNNNDKKNSISKSYEQI